MGQRFHLTSALFEELMLDLVPLDASEADVELSPLVRLLDFDELTARFRELAPRRPPQDRRGPLRAAISRLMRRAS